MGLTVYNRIQTFLGRNHGSSIPSESKMRLVKWGVRVVEYPGSNTGVDPATVSRAISRGAEDKTYILSLYRVLPGDR